jgi:hypothetical protein
VINFSCWRGGVFAGAEDRCNTVCINALISEPIASGRAARRVVRAGKAIPRQDPSGQPR